MFSLLFGFSVFEMLKNATGNIHKGQREGALALGFSERQAFCQFIQRLKVLTIDVDSQEFDFYGSTASIAAFCQKNDLSQSMAHALSLLFEELCLQLLPPHLPEPGIRWTAEYSEEKEQGMVRVEYGGGPFDIRQSDNELSLKVIGGIGEIAAYEYREGERLGNRVLLQVKKR